MSERKSVADARSAIVSGRDEDLQVNMDALLAARDAEWRAAVNSLARKHDGACDLSRGEPCDCGATTHNKALLALLAAMEVPHDGQ